MSGKLKKESGKKKLKSQNKPAGKSKAGKPKPVSPAGKAERTAMMPAAKEAIGAEDDFDLEDLDIDDEKEGMEDTPDDEDFPDDEGEFEELEEEKMLSGNKLIFDDEDDVVVEAVRHDEDKMLTMTQRLAYIKRRYAEMRSEIETAPSKAKRAKPARKRKKQRR